MRTIVFGGLLIIVLSVLPGLWLWWPKRKDDASRSDLGVALMTGALIAVAVLAIQVSIDEKTRKREEIRQDADARQNFELTLSLQQDLTGIRLDGKDLRGIHFHGKKLEGASLIGSVMDDVVLAEANLTGATLRGAKLADADMTGVRAEQANFEGAHLEGAVLTSSRLRGAQFIRAHLETAELRDAELLYANLQRSHLEGASFSRASLIGADLSGATWDSTTAFAGALYDRRTKWPDGVTQSCCRKTSCEAIDPPVVAASASGQRACTDT
jgi:uncharacterized protein YjbI with pentapeptide repeats